MNGFSDCSKIIIETQRFASLPGGVLVGSERSYLLHVEPRGEDSVSLQRQALDRRG